ncbi:MAG: polysaccharide deacetylase family protein [Defluviitaleaceae bacterium]|nr:polysaccharide deacetylase family protein [Defluviitaleaceae bacterium]
MKNILLAFLVSGICLLASASSWSPPVIENVPHGVFNPFDSKYGSPYTAEGKLSNKKMSWGYGKNKNHQPPTAQYEFDIRQFGGYYLGDITQKEIYLTWDEGYEQGHTAQILDVLLEKDVQAAFFVTKPYIKSHPDLVKRMVEEGHIVGNHTARHKPSPELSDEEFVFELRTTADYFKEVTGHDMPLFFRPPAGVYSARTLKLAQDMGYKTIFWSLAFVDWEINNQPGQTAALKAVTGYTHNGCIILLHAVSESNTQALADVIDQVREQGFVFKSLDDLPKYRE